MTLAQLLLRIVLALARVQAPAHAAAAVPETLLTAGGGDVVITSEPTEADDDECPPLSVLWRSHGAEHLLFAPEPCTRVTARAARLDGSLFVALTESQGSAGGYWNAFHLWRIDPGAPPVPVDIAPASRCDAYELPRLAEFIKHGSYRVAENQIVFEAPYDFPSPSAVIVRAAFRLAEVGEVSVLQISTCSVSALSPNQGIQGTATAAPDAQSRLGAQETIEELDMPTKDPEARYSVSWDTDQLFCTSPTGVRSSVRWLDLRSVRIRTTDAGPFLADVFWILEDTTSQCVVPQGADGESALLARLQQLPNFNSAAVIDAATSVENAEFICWHHE